MDLETENRIAAILMREAAELRRQAEKKGVHAYLQQPKARFRPNSRFLSATVRGVEQGQFLLLYYYFHCSYGSLRQCHFMVFLTCSILRNTIPVP